MPTNSPSIQISSAKDRWSLGFLLLGAIAIFAGQAWLLHRGQAPVMALLQNEPLVRPLVENQLGIDWHTWVSDPAVNQHVKTGLRAGSWLFGFSALCSIALLFLRVGTGHAKLLRRTLAGIILSGVVALAILAWLSYLDHNQVAFHYLEYSTGVITPLLWVMMLARSSRPGASLDWVGRIALAFTFTVHGFYAIGLEIPGSTSLAWTLPGSWVEMTVNGLGKAAALIGLGPPTEDAARQILFHVGIIDLVVAVAVLLPGSRKASLLYMAGWGLLTALARTWSNFQPEFAGESLTQWVPETLIRLPHFALPIFLLIVSFRPTGTSSSAPSTPS